MCFQRWSIAREYYLSTYASTFYGVFRHLTASGFSKISALKKLFKIKSKMNNNMKVTFKACTTAVLLFLLFFPQITQAQEQINLDRKSTRLNSSHVAISYAVFCLKKKIQSQH